MEDWRLRGQEGYLAGAVLRRVVFPDFWKTAYAEKNTFYQRIRAYALRQVEITHRWEELLEGESVGRFWHEHCEFCWEKAYTDKPCVFYCTEDLKWWICEECFHDFQEKFRWSVSREEQSDRPLPYGAGGCDL